MTLAPHPGPDRTPLTRWTWAVAAGAFLIRYAFAGQYGHFRDELYYLANGRHLMWGYVDHPPMVGLVAWLIEHTVGSGLWGLRLVPTALAGVMVVLVAALARELGGGTAAQLLAAVGTALAPGLLFLMFIFTMNCLDVVLCTALVILLTRWLRTDEARWWRWIGLVAGVALLTKLSAGFLLAGAGLGMVVSGRAGVLTRRPFLEGVAVATALVAPTVAWQAAHGFPMVEFMQRAAGEKNVALSPVAFLAEVAIQHGPVLVPVLLLGLWWLGRDRVLRPLAIMWLVVCAVFITGGGKPYYLMAASAVPLAAGPVALERLVAGRRWRWVLPAVAALVVVSGAAVVPVALPALEPDRHVAYVAALGLTPKAAERSELGRLRQDLADMFGWESLAEKVVAIAGQLPAEDRERVCVFASNYGEAAAIEHFGGARAPRVISGHNTYWVWGPRGCDGSVLIVVGSSREKLEARFGSVLEVDRTDCGDCMPYENHRPLWLVRQPRRPLEAMWPEVKNFI